MTNEPSRRALLTARFTKDHHHIASLLVQAWPDQIPAIRQQLHGKNGVEVHETDPKGQMIVTIEAVNDAGLMDTMSNIQKTDGVINTSLVYHQIEDESDV